MGVGNHGRRPVGEQIPKHRHRHRKGALFWCLVGAGVLLTLVLSVVVGLYLYGRHLRDSFTDTAPEKIPTIRLDRQEQQKTQQSFNRLVTAFERKAAGRFEFNDRQLNGIIAALPECRDLRGRARLEIRNGEPWVRASLPLDELGVSWLKGRYLNGEFRLVVRLKDGGSGMEIFVGDAIVKGGSLPPWMMRRLQEYDLAKELRRDSTWGSRVRQLATLDFELDKMIVRTRKDDE